MKKAAAKRIWVSQSLLQEFLYGGRGAGMKLLDAVSAYTGRSIEDLLGRSRDTPTPAREVVLDPRYPERSAAIAAVVALGATEDDAQRWADEAAVALDSEEDPERGWWVRRMLARRDETRKLAASLAAQQADEAKRERGEAPDMGRDTLKKLLGD